MKKQTFDLSGMGGGYEDMCQLMLWRGVLYLAEVKPPVKMWEQATEYKNIYGVMVTNGADLKGLEAAIIRSGDDATSAMHQCVMGHLQFIHKNGEGAWRAELAPHRTGPGDVFEWDDKGRLP